MKNIQVRIKRDQEWQEYVVKLFVDHKEIEDASYHTDSLEDAILTSSAMQKEAEFKLNGRLLI